MRVYRENVNASSRRGESPALPVVSIEDHQRLSSTVSVLQHDAHRAHSEWKDALSTLTVQLSSTASVATVQSHVDHLTTKHQQTTQQLADLDWKQQQLDQRLSDYHREVQQIQSRVEGILSAVSEQASRLSDCHQMASQSHHTLMAHSGTVASSQQILQQSHQEMQEMRAEIQRLSQRLDEVVKTARSSLGEQTGSKLELAFEDYKRVTDQRLEKLVNLFLSIRI